MGILDGIAHGLVWIDVGATEAADNALECQQVWHSVLAVQWRRTGSFAGGIGSGIHMLRNPLGRVLRVGTFWIQHNADIVDHC